jgi:integral membrane sensor domain MASE1
MLELLGLVLGAIIAGVPGAIVGLLVIVIFELIIQEAQ